MKVTDFDYSLPDGLIAQYPVEQRDESRLLVLKCYSDTVEHRSFKNIPEYLAPGDTLVLNETKVIPARLIGRLAPTGRKVELLLLKSVGEKKWEGLVRPGRKIRDGDLLNFQDEMFGRVVGHTEYGGRLVEFECRGEFMETLGRLGRVPLPPYIERDLVSDDRERYQTVYASREGSAAAPTAGLHFTERLLEQIQGQGVNVAKIVLHVGLDTFRPVKTDQVEEHRMHTEYYALGQDAADIINTTKAAGKRVIAVGTTVARCLETLGNAGGFVEEGEGWTDIFIYPGYRFKVLDGLITNFHLPKSTLLMLVSALAGRERMLNTYKTAVEMGYRFFSYGDAMLII